MSRANLCEASFFTALVMHGRGRRTFLEKLLEFFGLEWVEELTRVIKCLMLVT